MHNDLDAACRFWWGDRRPAAGDQRNRHLDGSAASLHDRRCVVCRPFSQEEEADLLAPPVFALQELGGASPSLTRAAVTILGAARRAREAARTS